MTWYRQNQEESKQGNLKLKLHTDNSQMSHFGKHPNINDLCKYLNAGAIEMDMMFAF